MEYVTIFLVSNIGSGDGSGEKNLSRGSTVRSLLGTIAGNRNPDNYLVRVRKVGESESRQVTPDYVFQGGERVTVSPTKVDAGSR